MQAAMQERLADKSVAVRAQAAQELGGTGALDDVLPLLELTQTDKSRSVKLCAAAAAADILARHRGAYGRPRVDDALAQPILKILGSVDPDALPTMLLCYAAFPTTDVIQRLTRMLRDLRRGVRSGAATSLKRMALSAAAFDEGTGLREWIGQALDHPRMPVDAAIDMIHLIGAAGWTPLRPKVERGLKNEVIAETANLALDRLDLRENPATWTGIWIDEGRDVLELIEPIDGDWLSLENVKVDKGLGMLDGAPMRRIWAPRLSEEGEYEAIQSRGQTWWRLGPERAVALVETQDRKLATQVGVEAVLLPMLDAQSGAGAMRAAAILLARTGHHDEALERLEQPLQGKRPRNDLYFLRGLALLGKGRTAEAHDDLRLYLEKARKSEPWREEARELLG